MFRTLSVALAASLLVVTLPSGGDVGAVPPSHRFTPGAAGVGDPYYPLDGNGGYDAIHYSLDITYDPATDVLVGTATIRARATQNLSSFNLDFEGLTVRDISVNGRVASFSRDSHELTVVPRSGLERSSEFTTVIRYDGIPQPIVDPLLGISGFIATDDGVVVAGQPHGADTWYPVNDHPSDAASYTFAITVPQGLQAVANGLPTGQHSRSGWTTWNWDAREPMASYLTTVDIGHFDLHRYQSKGIHYVDAIDPSLFVPPMAPHSGAQVLFSQQADASYKRLTRTLSVPASGAQLTFWVARSTEPNWDYFFVEARHANSDDWTTLPDAGGQTTSDTGFSCPGWLSLHPFLTNYETDNGDGTCAPVGTPPATGTWNAGNGVELGWTQWTVDLGAYAGSDVEISLSYASDESVQFDGVAIDDIVMSTGEGSTSFENDGDTLDGWMIAPAPAGSPGNVNDWMVATAADLPPSRGEITAASLGREPEILDFLASYFGRYPFKASGGIVDNVQGLGFALETQTRPVYSPDFFTDPVGGASVVVHELTHQWFGDSLRLRRWNDIWLNEGFATYAEWLWSGQQGLGTPQDIFDFFTSVIPPDDPFWSLTIGDPGTDHLFDYPVYARGAMTLHALRLTVGDDAFFKILRRWAQRQAGGNVSTAEFIDLAESISGMDLGALFDAWLYTPSKPEVPAASVVARTATASTAGTTFKPAVAAAEMRRWHM